MIMGYEFVSAIVAASVSRHNSPRDTGEDKLWAELVARLRRIVEEPRYREISAAFEAYVPGEDDGEDPP